MSISDTPTPRPWRHETSFTHSSGRVLLDGNGYLFASFDDAGNAAHAVRCVNAHDDLLAACEAAARHHQGGHSEVGALLRAAIAKARGQ